MHPVVLPASDLADRVAREIAAALRTAVATRGVATLALSGGSTPAPMLARLARLPVPWEGVHVLQADERIAPDDDPDRNLTALRHHLLDHPEVAPAGVHPVPVGDGRDPDAVASAYASVLRDTAGEPAVLDVVQLGLGADGHTASLVPHDPALEVRDRDVVATGPYRGRRRVTLTLPALARARRLVWMVAGADKAAAVARLAAGDPTIPAGRVATGRAVLLVDAAAGAEL